MMPPAGYTLRELAQRLGGEVMGDAGIVVRRVATLENARSDSITFVTSSRYLPQLEATAAGAVIVGPALRDATERPRIVSANPYAYFAHVSALFNPPRDATPGVHSTAVVDGSATIAPDAEIGPLAVVGARANIGARCCIGAGSVIGNEVTIGSGTRLNANVTIYERCVLGERVIVHSGAVIGADGFGIAMEDDRWVKIPQIGRVVIADDVEIGANTTIDRGTIDDTILEQGVKLDNQIQIAHNVRIGAHTAIAACVGIAGSTNIGRYCRIGGAVGIAGHITIADHVEISGYTAVTRSIEKAGTYSGLYPFESNRQWRRNAVHLRHLDELADRIRALEKKLAASERSES